MFCEETFGRLLGGLRRFLPLNISRVCGTYLVHDIFFSVWLGIRLERQVFEGSSFERICSGVYLERFACLVSRCQFSRVCARFEDGVEAVRSA